jgi:hypothetical protein
MASDQPPADADLDALVKQVDRWSATHSERSNQTRDLLYRLLAALRAARTAQAQAEQARDRLVDALDTALFPHGGLYGVADDGLTAFMDGFGERPLADVLGEHVESWRTRRDRWVALTTERDALAAKLAAAEQQRDEARALHQELMFQVGKKYPGETRHETAKRYIREHENCGHGGPCRATTEDR